MINHHTYNFITFIIEERLTPFLLRSPQKKKSVYVCVGLWLFMFFVVLYELVPN